MVQLAGIPLRRFAGELKSLRFANNEGFAMQLLDLAFPRFRGSHSVNDARFQRIYSAFHGPRALESLLRAAGTSRRRYSGGSLVVEALPRGRYYSVCTPLTEHSEIESPDDLLLLQFELLAYTHSAATPVLAFDRAQTECREVLEEMGWMAASNNAIAVAFVQRPADPLLFDLIFAEERSNPGFRNEDWAGAYFVANCDQNPFTSGGRGPVRIAGFNLYYEIEHHTIDDVLDLRYSDMQEAFVRQFWPDLQRTRTSLNAEYGFLQLLPTLLTQQHGGSQSTDAIGAQLRAEGVAALIYPSARYNAYAQFEAGRLERFAGWNLVDFRGASGALNSAPPKHLPLVMNSGLTIEVPTAQVLGYGSWKVRGIVERTTRRQERRLRSYFDS
jgi:hypothetical protein